MFYQPVPLWLSVVTLAVTAGVTVPAVAKARAARTERESQRQLDMFELGLRVAAERSHS